MTDDELRRAYAAYRATPARANDERANRPSLDEMRQLADGATPRDDREALLDRILSDAESTRELALLRAVSGARTPEKRWTPAHWWTVAAAAVVIVIATPLLRTAGDARREQTFRTAARTDGAPELLAPRDGEPLVRGLRLTWSAVPNVEQYVVELVTERGDAIARITTRDTTLILPDSVSADRLHTASGWMLVARLRDGGQRQSVLRLTAKRAP